MNKPVIKAILFDLDDTLWDIQPVLARAETILYQWLTLHAPSVAAMHTIESLREHRMTLARHDPSLKVNLLALRHKALSQIFNEHNLPVSLADSAMTLFSTARNTVTLFDDVLPAFDQLREHWVLGSVTNGTTDLSVTGLTPYFRTSIASYQFGVSKPETAIFHAAASALNIAPEHIAYVGDDPVFDVQGAKQAGMHAVWMNRFDRHYAGEFTPDAQCTDLFGLLAWLNTHTDKPHDHE